MTQDPECDGLVEKYKNADRPETRCLRGLRRKPGSDQLGLSDSVEALVPWRMNMPTPSTPSSPSIPPIPSENVAVKTLLAELEQHKSDWKEEQWRLKEKRDIWEASLPTNFDRHSNYVTPGHTLEYINQGTPAPKKKRENFNVSTRHKRRNSSQ